MYWTCQHFNFVYAKFRYTVDTLSVCCKHPCEIAIVPPFLRLHVYVDCILGIDVADMVVKEEIKSERSKRKAERTWTTTRPRYFLPPLSLAQWHFFSVRIIFHCVSFYVYFIDKKRRRCSCEVDSGFETAHTYLSRIGVCYAHVGAYFTT